ncbi:MAG: hypothetical protein LUQ11_00475 [Methylococcaceae bacterium]|nr:hypothetical protein [Methylococcaceae bacterium]
MTAAIANAKPGTTNYCAVAFFGFISLATLPALADGVEHHTPPFLPTGMAMFNTDSLLVWRDDGRLQIRDGKGVWSAVVQLPMQKIMQIRPDASGLLALGAPETPFGPSLIIALDPAGKESERWSVAGAWDITVSADARQAVTLSGVRPLLPQAAVGAEQAFPKWAGKRPENPQFPPKLLYWEAATIYCHPADLSMQHYAPARCERPGAEGWIYEYGESMQAPVACGPWLVVNEGKHQEQLTVLEMATGKIRSRRKFHSHPRIACAGEDQLAIAERSLEQAQLPALNSTWHASIGKDQIIELAALPRYLAYRTEKSLDVILMPSPRRSD